MYTDPQTLTVNAVAKAAARVSAPNPTTTGVFATADGDFKFAIKQDVTAARFRREARFTQRKIAVDPISATNKEVSTSIIFAIDEPKWGFNDTELGYLTSALIAWLSAGNLAKLMGGEL